MGNYVPDGTIPPVTVRQDMNENMDSRGFEDDDSAERLEPIIDYDDLTGYDLTRYELSPEERAYEEMIRQRIRERRRAAERRRIKRNRTVALVILFVILFIVCRSCYASHEKKRKAEEVNKKPSSAKVNNENKPAENGTEAGDPLEVSDGNGHKFTQADGLTFVDGILIVNKTYSLPKEYAPGINSAAQAAFDDMTAAAFNDGLYLYVNSGYRSYDEQYSLYYNYAANRGVKEADKVSSRPGHSEHQSGLCFDVNSTDFSFNDTAEARHCADYGFIIRFPKGKEAITGYEYESWHIRYVGIETAKEITSKGLCLEEYLGVTSDYVYAADGKTQQQLAEELGVPLDDPYTDDQESSDIQAPSDTDENSESAQTGYTDDYNYYY